VSPWTRLRTILIVAFLCILSPAWLASGVNPNLPLAVKLLPLGLGVVLAAYAYLSLVSVELAVTDRRIMVKTGVVGIDTAEMFLSRVQGIEVTRSVAGRLLGYGTVRVRGAGTEVLAVAGLSHPAAFRAVFDQAAHEGAARVGVAHV
jgi:uncharacterized membrane protein YdbT with pleckstrin-like domain